MRASVLGISMSFSKLNASSSACSGATDMDKLTEILHFLQVIVVFSITLEVVATLIKATHQLAATKRNATPYNSAIRRRTDTSFSTFRSSNV